MFSKHVTKDISAYCHGELSHEESRRFAEHIISCAKCRSEFEDIKLGIKFAEQLPTLSAPDSLWRDLEPYLGKPRRADGEMRRKGDGEIFSASPPLPVSPAGRKQRRAFRTSWQLRTAAVAAVLLVIASLGIWIFWNKGSKKALAKQFWQVQRLDGAPRIGSETIAKEGKLAVGDWLETDGSSRAQIAVGSIGRVNIDENTRVRLLETEPTEHRLELARGKMSAMIWAPPRLFFVDTPSAVAADLGCAYTLQVDDHGAGLLRVTAGWVALELKDRESIVPTGAACETRPGVGPGTPYFEDAAPSFREALSKFDYDPDAAARSAAFDVLLTQARPPDTLTLWHLLARVEGNDRARVFDKIASFVPPPAGVTREGVLQLDREMLDRWKRELELNWGPGTLVPKAVAEAYWKVKNGVSRRMKDVAPR